MGRDDAHGDVVRIIDTRRERPDSLAEAGVPLGARGVVQDSLVVNDRVALENGASRGVVGRHEVDERR